MTTRTAELRQEIETIEAQLQITQPPLVRQALRRQLALHQAELDEGDYGGGGVTAPAGLGNQCDNWLSAGNKLRCCGEPAKFRITYLDVNRPRCVKRCGQCALALVGKQIMAVKAL